MDVLFYTLSHKESAKHKFRAFRAKSNLQMKKIIFFPDALRPVLVSENKLFELIDKLWLIRNMYCSGKFSVPDKSI